MTMVMDGGAAVDVEDREMEMEMTIDMILPDEGEMKIGEEVYIIDDMMYIMMDIPGMGPMWMKSENSRPARSGSRPRAAMVLSVV